MIDDVIRGDPPAAVVGQRQPGQPVEERPERRRADAEGDAMEAGGVTLTLRLTLEQRQLRVAAVARDHQRTSRVVGPVLGLGDDPQPDHSPVPFGRLTPVGYEYLDVINPIDCKSIVHVGSLAK
jgi:hypothetical protein